MPNPPKAQPTCTFPPPPVPTIYWGEGSWEKWIGLHCKCEAHIRWRADNDTDEEV